MFKAIGDAIGGAATAVGTGIKSAAGGLADMFGGSQNYDALGNSMGRSGGIVGAVGKLPEYGANIGQFAADNKGLIDTGLAGLSAYGEYQSAQDQKKYAQDMMNMQRTQMNRQEAERQRQIDKEKEQQNAMLTGFSSAGL